MDEHEELLENEPKSEENQVKKDEFKKPILIGKIGQLPRKVLKAPKAMTAPSPEVIDKKNSEKETQDDKAVPVQQSTQNTVPLPYTEPIWSGLPESNGADYKFEVLKNGAIIESINLMKKAFWVFGRLTTCDISMQHPTISRYHAVLQYRSAADDNHPAGFYLYDLESTHGTFLNKNKIKTRIYVRIQVGHMLKLGCSTRTYLLTGPVDDEEEESDLSVTELKQKRAEQIKKAEEEREARIKAEEERQKREEERGVDWGMGEDADEDTDLSENPFAQTNNEELYLDDPKKALRGFFEREGLDLEYDCSEQGMGQFLCKVELPLDDERGRPIVAEVLHKGKKKEAVIQCALEACRILDRHGVLRQAVHESRKRKAKNWEENDFYDSDDDTFLDRTGTVEKKREKRMNAKQPQKAETYESLLQKEQQISESINKLEEKIRLAQEKFDANNAGSKEEDSLDSYMNQLKESNVDKKSLHSMKSELNKLKQEHVNVVKLVNIAKPASLPPLVASSSQQNSASSSKSKLLPMFGKRKKLKVNLPQKPTLEELKQSTPEGDDDEEEEDKKSDVDVEVKYGKEDLKSKEETSLGDSSFAENSGSSSETVKTEHIENPNQDEADECKEGEEKPPSTLVSIAKELGNASLLSVLTKHENAKSELMTRLWKLAEQEDRLNCDFKLLKAKKKKLIKLVSDFSREHNPQLQFKILKELSSIISELNSLTYEKCAFFTEVQKVKMDFVDIHEETTKELEKLSKIAEEKASTSRCDDVEDGKKDDSARKQKKNQKRIMQRKEKAEIEKKTGYDEDAKKEDYNMWIPYPDQSGDGRTKLNDKYGY